MKFAILSRLFIAGVCLWLLTISVAAQEGFGSDTSIAYDEETNTVTAYAETDGDYDLLGDYQAKVTLTVLNEYGVVVAIDSAVDEDGDGIASVELSFAGEAGRTYTAVGRHQAKVYQWDYENYYPYQTFYFDN